MTLQKILLDKYCKGDISFYQVLLEGIMKQQIKYLFILVSLFIVGCANLQQEQFLKDTKSQLSNLNKTQTETNLKLEELNNKFLLLKEQLDNTKIEVRELRTMAIPIMSPVMPPEDIKVIKLETGEMKQEAKRENIEEKKVIQPGPEELYQEAQNLFMSDRLSDSRERFAAFILSYPKHTLSDNAQYWIGETYYSEKDYQKALIEFKKVVDNYPSENKAADALLKVGFSYLELNNREKGLEVFKIVMEQYPSSAAANKARIKLQEIQR